LSPDHCSKDINFPLQELFEKLIIQQISLGDPSSPRSIGQHISPISCEFQDDQPRKTQKDEKINRNESENSFFEKRFILKGSKGMGI
jgi:hypothetical protein